MSSHRRYRGSQTSIRVLWSDVRSMPDALYSAAPVVISACSASVARRTPLGDNMSNGQNFRVVFRDDKYDIRRFLRDHPGGVRTLERFKDRSVLEAMERFEHTASAYHMLKDFKIDNGNSELADDDNLVGGVSANGRILTKGESGRNEEEIRFLEELEPDSVTDVVQDVRNKIEDSAKELQRRHRSTSFKHRDHRVIFSYHHDHYDRGHHQPCTDGRAGSSRTNRLSGHSTTQKKAKEELLRAQIQFVALRLAALETKETGSKEDYNIVVQDQEAQKIVGNWVDAHMKVLAITDAPHQGNESMEKKIAKYRRARARHQNRHITRSLHDLDPSRVRNRTEETDRNPGSSTHDENLTCTAFST
ncbi:Cytochrome b5-like protein [Eumeta japonica]|uniref:Cytochrome b5-like protein n=1 Tax=Eumeta variegata TaxID=151549 RepID=A0A4C1XTW1_EUMVA|nr:Cytochrome b5-like protein [Eumeta japonica]